MKTQEQLVDAFASQMKLELEANKHKGDWQKWDNITEMWQELDYHEDKLSKAIQLGDRKRVKEHIADCANFLLMIGNAYDL